MKEWVYGKNPIYEILRANRRRIYCIKIAQGAQVKGRLSKIIELSTKRGISLESLTTQQMNSYVKGNQGIIAQVGGYPYIGIKDILDNSINSKDNALILILDSLEDPQNLGTLLRTADAVGVHGVVLPLYRTATITPAVVNSSSGATEHLFIAQANLNQTMQIFKKNNIWVIGLEPDRGIKSIDKKLFNSPIAIIIGSEGAGMRQLIRKSCDTMISLPMRGKVDSLNAATAGSIILYQVYEARGF